MIADIGDDMAPVLNTDYNLEDPIKGYIKIQEYIEEVDSEGGKNIQTKAYKLTNQIIYKLTC